MAKRLSDYANEFLKQQSLEQEFSPHTYRARSVDLKRFVNFFKDKISAIDSRSWQGFCGWLVRGLKPNSVNRAHCTHRAFFEFLSDLQTVLLHFG